MKKILSFALVAAAMLFAGKANAQLSINAGYAPQTYTTTFNDKDTKTELNGFFVGANYNIGLTGDLRVSIGADFRYNTKSDSDAASLFGVNISGKATSTQMLIDVPVLFNYGLNINRDFRLAAFAGPTFSMALSGKTEFEGNIVALGGTTEYDWYGDNAIYNKFNLSLTFGICADFRDFRLFGGYNLGLLNVDARDNLTTKGNNWFIGLGYNL